MTFELHLHLLLSLNKLLYFTRIIQFQFLVQQKHFLESFKQCLSHLSCLEFAFAEDIYHSSTGITQLILELTLHTLDVSAAYNFIAASSTANFSRKP